MNDMTEEDLYCIMTWAWKNEGSDEKADALCYLFQQCEELKQQVRDMSIL
jgi:hypothetical protein